MESIRDIFVIGNGPSSSHTMGPSFATSLILKKYPDIESVNVTLFGSLALTGKGHLTDYIIDKKLGDVTHTISFDLISKKKHPNTMEFLIKTKDGEIHKETIYSVGGGTIQVEGCVNQVSKAVYQEDKLSPIMTICKHEELSLFDYVYKHEGSSIIEFFKNVIKAMDHSVEEGLNAEGVLPGKLQVKRKAKQILANLDKFKDNQSNLVSKTEIEVAAYAFAASETNASGGIVCTAPTCGSCGVIPGCIRYLRLKNIPEDKIIEGLCVAGLIGKLVKTNASVSGAMCGCQAEIGVACSMAAAMVMYCFGGNYKKIAQAAEIALEHSLGLTCDPIEGYVQIPCIERNAIYALKAINAASLASFIDNESRKISFDDVVKTMYETGLDLKAGYKETSKKGMSKIKKFLGD